MLVLTGAAGRNNSRRRRRGKYRDQTREKKGKRLFTVEGEISEADPERTACWSKPPLTTFSVEPNLNNEDCDGVPALPNILNQPEKVEVKDCGKMWLNNKGPTVASHR